MSEQRRDVHLLRETLDYGNVAICFGPSGGLPKKIPESRKSRAIWILGDRMRDSFASCRAVPGIVWRGSSATTRC